MSLELRNLPRLLVIGLLLTCIAIPAAHAEFFEDDDDDEEGFAFPVATNAAWREECGSCHIAFPAHMLPPNSWRALMGGLDKHFGSDASLDAGTNREITAFLEKYAGRRWYDPVTKPQLRITETRWFKSEHREVAPRVWSNPKVKSPTNCAACHTQAEYGRFGERDIRIPR